MCTPGSGYPNKYRAAKEGTVIPEEQAFMKKDTGKNRLELIEPAFVEGLGNILTFGANKYEAHNWKKGGDAVSIERIKGSLLRHLYSYLNDDKIDKETGYSHIYHITCNLMFLDYFDRQKEIK